MSIEQPRFKSSPAHTVAIALTNSLRCPSCGHFHKYDPCRFPNCGCEPRAERPGHGPINAIDMDENGDEP
jgi:hypothetical protein